MAFWGQCRGIFLLAMKGNYVFFLLLFAVVVSSFVLMSGVFSARQPATMAMDVGISVVRLLVPVWIFFQVQDLVFKEFERRYCFLSFSYPVSRVAWLLARVVVVLFLLILMCVSLFSMVLLSVSFFVEGYAQSTPVSMGAQFWVMVFFQCIDFMVVMSVAFLIAIYSNTSGFVFLGSFGFMVVARSYADVFVLVRQSPMLVGYSGAEDYSFGLSVLRFIVPDLGGLDVRGLALYGEWYFLSNDTLWVLISNVFYFFMVLLASFLALSRKRIS